MTAFSRLRAGLLASAAATALLTAAGAAQALPTGGTVVAEQVPGTTIFVGEGGNTMTITQQGDRVVINWTDYDIGSDDSVQYIQPNSGAVAFNRVLGGSVADIQGSLSGDAGVFIFSPGGMMIGGGATINVGAFLASATQLPESEYSNVLSTGALNLPPPASPTPGFPGVTIMQGASITASNGFIGLVGSNLTIDGDLHAEGEVVYVAAEGAFFNYNGDPEFGLSLATFAPGYVAGRGQVTVNQGQSATVYAGAGFALVTPPPVLEPGFQTIINLDGLLTADGAFQGTDASVILSAGPAVPPGHASDTSGLVSPGSLGIVLDTQDLIIDAEQGITASAGTLRLGEMNAGGDIDVRAFGDIDFRGAINADGSLIANNALGLGGSGGIGNVNVFEDWFVEGNVLVRTYGDFTMLADSGIFTSGIVSVTGNLDPLAPVGVNTFTMSDNTIIDAEGVGIVSEGAVVIGDASITGYSVGVDILQLDAGGGITLNDGASVSGGGIGLVSRGLVAVEDGAMVHSWSDDNTWWDHWPVSIYDRTLGGVYVEAADIRVEGFIASSQGEGGRGGLILNATGQASQIYVGGADAGPQTGVWRLSNDEFQNLYGFVSIGPGKGVSTPIPLEVLDLDIDANYVPLLLLTSFGAGDIRVSGTVRGFAESGGECEVECEVASFGLGDSPEVRFGQWVAVVSNNNDPDSWVSMIPRDILVTGALGTEDNPLGSVRMAAQRDILIGTPSYVGAAQGSSAFDPQVPQLVDAPDADHLFIVSSDWNMLANGRVMQQNSALLNEGHAGFLIDTPQSDEPLFPDVDFGDLLSEIETEMDINLDFGSNAPVFPDYSAGPARISLHGELYDGEADEFIGGDDVAEYPSILSPNFTTGLTYFINDCQIGGCDTGTFGDFIAAFSPATGYQYPVIVARLQGETIINQVAERVVIDWDQFDIGADETVVFEHPSTTAITYNRVEFNGPYLQGRMTGQGGVFLFSPQGMTVESGAEIDVGSLLLSAAEMPDSEISNAFSSNTLSLPPALFLGEGTPTVAVNDSATITANNGFVALVAPSIEMHGAITASDNVVYILGEGASLDWDIGPNDPGELDAGQDSLINLMGAAQYVAGRGSIALDHTGTVLAGGGFALITPPPVLGGSQDTVLELGGSITAEDTLVAGEDRSVLLHIGGALRPGYDETNTLVAPGAGGIILDASGGSLTAAQDIGGVGNGASFGEVTTPGHFGFGATGDIAFFGEVVVGSFGVGNGSQANLPFGVIGDGDFAFHADVTTTTGDLIFGTRGHVTIDPGVRLSSAGDLLFGDKHPLPGALSVTIGAGASLSAAENLSWNGNQGPVSIGAGASLSAGTDLTFIGASVAIGQGATLDALGSIGFTSLGATSIGDDAELTAEGDVTFNGSAGPVTIGAGALLSGGGDVRFGAGSLAVGSGAQIVAGEDIVINSGGATTIAGGLSAGDDITLSSGGALTLHGATLDAGLDLVFNGQSVSIDGSALSAGNDIRFTSLGDVVIQNGASLKAGQDIEWSSQASTLVSGAAFVAGDDIVVSAASLSFGPNSDLQATNDIELTSSTALSIGDNSDLEAGGAVALTSTGSTTLGQGVRVDAGAISIAAGGVAIGADSELHAGLGISIAAGAGPLAVGDGAKWSAGEEISLVTSGAFTIGAGAALTAGDDIVVSGGSLSVGPNAGLQATNDIKLTSGAALSVGDGSDLDAGGVVALTSTGSATLGQGVQVHAGAISISAKGASIGADSELDAGSGIAIAAGSGPLAIAAGAELSAGDGISLVTTGALTIGANAVLTAGNSLSLSSGAFSTGVGAQLTAGEDISLGASSVSIGAGAGLAADGGIAIQSSGALTVGASAELDAGDGLRLRGQSVIVGSNASLTAGDVLDIDSGGSTQIANGAHVIAGHGLIITSDGILTVGAGALLQSSGYSADPGGEFPIAVLDPRLGGVYIRAADIDLQGMIVALDGEDAGEIWIDAGPGADQVVLGGTESATSNPGSAIPGVFQLSNAEFQNLRGSLVLGSSVSETSGFALEVRNLTINGDHVPAVSVGAYHSGDIGITGVVESTGSAQTVFRVGGVVIAVDPDGPDAVLSGVPRDILITGALGTEDNPLTLVQLIATRDILMGTQSYIDAARGDALFNPIRPPATITAPSANQIFIASETFQAALNGRLFQQNSGGRLGSGVIIGAPTEESPLINGIDWEEIYDGLDLELDFPTNPPPDLPDLTGGPVAVSLYGVLVLPGGLLIEGGEAAQADFLLSPDLLVKETYFFNGCRFYGACGSPEQNQATTFYDPTQGPNVGFEVLDAISNNPLIGGNLLIADFIGVPEYDPGVDPNGIAGSVTGAGNGDLWVVPEEEEEEEN